MRQSEALAILNAGANVFLTGAPGAGKTYVLNEFIRGARADGADVAVTASTGIASTHIDGQTIHSWSGIGLADVLTASLLKTIRTRRRRRIQAADILVIDEVSMLHAWLFDMVDQVCRQVRHDPRPFGGLQVVISGDFFQLPPVSVSGRDRDVLPVRPEFIASRERYARAGLNPEGFVTESLVWAELDPAVCYLTEQHRQDDGKLLGVLSDIRSGCVSDADRGLLVTRLGVRPAEGEVAVHLFPVNRQADNLNDMKLARIDAEQHTFHAEQAGPANLVDRLKRNMLAPEQLVLKEGAAVMALRNDTDRQFVNGSLGTVRGFAADNKGGWPIVEFENGNIVTMKQATWEMMDGDEVLASVSQVPLRCAWGITIHKSQGMTLDRAVMDLRRTFAPGMGYVALSRVESLGGLYLEGVNNRMFLVSPDAVMLDGDLREASAAASDLLVDQGAGAFKPSALASASDADPNDEFAQESLF
ncbi:ATP-dependent endonuclease [Bifidobacterium sp. UTCIF-37]|uniref:DEAD/DEAH box helicase n=1 Tax=unclassified Bifidobacterium TaxID=2608897 RepID=UPI00112CC0F5|nr:MULTISPECIES: PIF1 family DEAD/DEAH box helicase [unclassified Bifidobacterium]TPF85730.1 ATP-dependent endonuclease [Bifidobacterium sp. UTCIF-37]TPF88009.1 ATP-dependent endonuclease [Bifidobacterium sp. UTCIF-38]